MKLSNIDTLFLDAGYTICFPLTGNWRFTKIFLDCVDIDQFKRLSDLRKEEAIKAAEIFLFSNHHLSTIEEEYEQNVTAYSIIADHLQGLSLSNNDIYSIVEERTYNMDNYVFYPKAIESLQLLSELLHISIISDAWPSSR